MNGKTIVITGATSGIGLVASERLAAMGARIIFIARDRTRGETTLAKLRSIGKDQVHRVLYADLSILSEMKRIGSAIAATEPRIDVLMNNAGAMFQRKQTTADGLEMTFALNHMAYFVLSNILRARLVATPGARIINTSSQAHRGAHVDYNDLQGTRRFRMFPNYCLSKLYNILFTRELSRRLHSTGVTVNALHPGFVATHFGDATSGAFGILFRLLKVFAISPEEGAKTMVFLASSTEVGARTGEYFIKCSPRAPTKDALDRDAAQWLWRESEQIAAL